MGRALLLALALVAASGCHAIEYDRFAAPVPEHGVRVERDQGDDYRRFAGDPETAHVAVEGVQLRVSAQGHE